MNWFIEHADVIASLFAVATGAWTAASHLHKTAMAHLSQHFATKADLQQMGDRLETKLDSALERAWRAESKAAEK